MSENPMNVDLGEQEPRGCRFVHGDPGVGPWFYCQSEIANGGRPGNVSNPPYCQKHRDQIYKPQQAYIWKPDKFDKRLGDPLTTLDRNVVLAMPNAGDGPRLPVDTYMALRNRGLSHD